MRSESSEYDERANETGRRATHTTMVHARTEDEPHEHGEKIKLEKMPRQPP